MLRPSAVARNARRLQLASSRRRPLHVAEVGKFRRASYKRTTEISSTESVMHPPKSAEGPHPNLRMRLPYGSGDDESNGARAVGGAKHRAAVWPSRVGTTGAAGDHHCIFFHFCCPSLVTR